MTQTQTNTDSSAPASIECDIERNTEHDTERDTEREPQLQAASAQQGIQDSRPGGAEKPESCWPGLWVIAFTILFMVLSYYWVTLNQAPPAEDDNMQLIKALDHYRDFVGSWDSVLRTLLYGHVGAFYPPLIYNITSVLFYLGGERELMAFMSILLWTPLLTYSTYQLGKRLWGPWAGACACLATLASSLIQYYSHCFFLDFPLTAIVTWHYLTIIQCERFSNKRWTVLWGLSLAAGFLIKWTFALWILLPDSILFLGWLLAGLSRPISWQQIRGIIGKLCFCALLLPLPAALPYYRLQLPPSSVNALEIKLTIVIYCSLAVVSLMLYLAFRRVASCYPLALAAIINYWLTMPWYVENANDLIVGLNMTQDLSHQRDIYGIIAQNWTYIHNNLWFINAFIALTCAAALIASFKNWNNLKKLSFSILLAFSGLSLVTAIFVGSPRYTLPAVPSLAILCCGWISYLGKRDSWGFALLLPAFLYTLLNWLPVMNGWHIKDNGSLEEKCYNYLSIPSIQQEPHTRPNVVKQVLADLSVSPNSWKGAYPLPVWIITGNDCAMSLQGRCFIYYNTLLKLPLDTIQCEKSGFMRYDKSIRSKIRNCDYIVVCFNSPSILEDNLQLIHDITKCRPQLCKKYVVDTDTFVYLYRNMNTKYDYNIEQEYE